MTVRTLTAIGIGLAALLLVAMPARGAGEVATRVTVSPVEPTVIGTHGEVTAVLDVVGGGPLADRPLELSLDGQHLRRTRTDLQGTVTFSLPRDLAPGEHSLTVSYPGETDAFLPAAVSTTWTVRPFELVVETVPAIAGMPFSLDGERFVSGEDGVARIEVDTMGERVLEVLPDGYRGEPIVEFNRWAAEFGRRLTIRVPFEGTLQAGFDVFAPARQTFVDLDGDPVDPDRIASITIRTSLGAVLEYPDGAERLYKVSRVVRRTGLLEAVPIRYNVEAVEVDGSNVVNSGQQRFVLADSGEVWEISLLLYSAHIYPRDALFGLTAGDAAEVIYPSGKVERIEADENGIISAHFLARGIYRMSVADPPGWAPAVPVALSRDQEVELRVVTYLDMGIALVVALGLPLGLLHRGRPHLIPGVYRTARRGLAVGWQASRRSGGNAIGAARRAIGERYAARDALRAQAAGETAGQRSPAIRSAEAPADQATGDHHARTRAARRHNGRAKAKGGSGGGRTRRQGATGSDGKKGRASDKRAGRSDRRKGVKSGKGTRKPRTPSQSATPAASPARAEAYAVDEPPHIAQLRVLGIDDMPVTEDVAPVVSQPAASNPTCSTCGFTLSVGARFCRRCGNNLQDPSSAEPRTGEQRETDAVPVSSGSTSSTHRTGDRR